MKRARIKAMVTVPTRRKATPVAPAIEASNLIEQNEKGKGIFNDISTMSQENNYEEKQIQEGLDVIKQSQNEQLDVDRLNKEYTDESVQNFEESKKEFVQISETVCQTQISSPTKLMQSRLGFMKPVPKFDSSGKVRKNSIQGSGASASESEDDNKRIISTNSNNMRNDATSLVQAAKDTVSNNIKNNLTASKVGQKRRILVSESARKLAEARREFQIKHENKTPDRSKLTMYDLIYYNPVTNPMKKPKESTVTTRKTIEYLPQEFQEEEEEEENEDDPSSAMPVPQVKVGPNGQLIIDEQSLVIEQTNAKKSKEVLSKEAIIDDDNSGNGFYKKRQKSKEWSKWETLKFYKALNTVGTDFLLMQSLFPNRTRQEIKLKFKKEEKVNRNLVEKALAYHQEFDTEILEKSLATFESLEEKCFVTQEKQKEHKGKDKKNTKSRRRRKSRIVASSIAEMDISDKEDEEEEEYDLNLMVHKENNKVNCDYQEILDNVDKKMTKERDSLAQKSPMIEDDVDSLSSCNGPDSDTEVYNVKPTRSGRFPKVKKLQGPDINTLDNKGLDYCLHNSDKITMSPEKNAKVAKNLFFDNTNIDSDTHHTNSIKTVIPNIADVEPGSLVILSKELPEEPGKSVLQVYMVSSDVNSHDLEKSNITPVNISPELLATVTAKLSNAESVPVKKNCE
ncbi:Transcription factor TFIIIB component B'' homolog [Anthophora retusa]